MTGTFSCMLGEKKYPCTCVRAGQRLVVAELCISPLMPLSACVFVSRGISVLFDPMKISVHQMLLYGLIKVSAEHYTACRLTAFDPQPQTHTYISQRCSVLLSNHLPVLNNFHAVLWCVNRRNKGETDSLCLSSRRIFSADCAHGGCLHSTAEEERGIICHASSLYTFALIPLIRKHNVLICPCMKAHPPSRGQMKSSVSDV